MASSSPKTVPHVVHNGSVSPPMVPAVQHGSMAAPATLTPHPMPVRVQMSHQHHHQHMKSAPVMVKVAGRGGEMFVHHNPPPHMDQAMHYLLQHQLNLGEQHPTPTVNNGQQQQHHHQQAPQPIAMSAPNQQQNQQQYQHQAVHQREHQQEFGQSNNATPACGGENSYGEPLPLHHHNNIGEMNLSFWPEVQAHKQEDAHVMHLRELMKCNLKHRHQNMQPHGNKNNCRASAA